MLNEDNAENAKDKKRKVSETEESNDNEVQNKIIKSDNLITSLTQLGYNKPVQILVFPPKNQQFQFDESTDTMRLEPAGSAVQESEFIDNSTADEILSSQSMPLNNTENVVSNSTLTPLIENCDIDNKKTQQLKCDEDSKKLEKFNESWKLVHKIEKPFLNSKIGTDCFLKGCKWSPDGYCLLSCSDDNVLRLFEFSEEDSINFDEGKAEENDIKEATLHMKEGGMIYDYAWYPKMNSADPVSCV